MTFEYFPDTDTLYIALREGPGADAAEVAPDVMLDYDEAGQVTGITLERASERADLGSFRITQIPALRSVA